MRSDQRGPLPGTAAVAGPDPHHSAHAVESPNGGERHVIFLMGATAVGKTDVAVELAARLPVDIVSVDSAMVYTRMDIGTGKPDHTVLVRAPHRLIDIREPHQTYSAANFAVDARREIDRIHGAGRVPLLVGGTGLYFRALAEGLADLPQASPAVRARITAAAERVGWQRMHDSLAAIDAPSAAKIHPHDTQRIQRALEVYELTHRPLSELVESARAQPLPHRVQCFILDPENREWLHQQIAARFRTMLEQGLVAEVAALRTDRRLGASSPSMRSVGYRQVWQFLAGECDDAQMCERGIVATRQLAKRQMTWLRSTKQATRIPCSGVGAVGLAAQVERLLEPIFG